MPQGFFDNFEPAKDWAYENLVKKIPVNIRTLIGTVAGDNSEINENNFSQEDLDTLKNAVSMARDEGTNNLAPHNYLEKQAIEDYNKGKYQEKDLLPYGYKQSPLNVLKESFYNPAYRMQTTIGNASFNNDQDGNYIINDKYDFFPIYRGDLDIKSKGFFNVLKTSFDNNHTGIVDFAHSLGEYFAPDSSGEGRKVRINLGK
jgi:hypothetical protein